MSITGADIIAQARSYIGKFEDGPDVPKMAREIGQAFPEFATYVTEATNAMPWCGDFVAYVLMQFGIHPPPVKDGVGFFYVDRWEDFGTPIPVGQEQPGDIAGFVYPPDLHHVTFVAGGGQYVGGNQHDAVTETHFSATPSFIRRAPTTGAVVQPAPKATDQFNICVALVLKDEGGNDDDPRDPGGRTSRGITKGDWDAWREGHPGLPSDVWQAPQDQVVAIYHQKYWAPLRCDDLPAGVDYAVFDYGVNSGIYRSAKVLQQFVKTDVDGEIGPNTIAATARADPETLVGQLCDERMSFLQGLRTWGTFGRGWTNRVNGVRAHALAMVTAAPPRPIDPDEHEDPDPDVVPPSANPELDACLRDIIASVRPILEKHMAPVPATKLAPDLTSLLDLLGQLGIKPQPPAPPPPVTSKLDIGGTTGWKTITGLIGLVATVFGAPAVGIDTGGGLFAGLTAAFAALTSVGFVAKLDRGIKIAQQVSDALHKLSDQQQKTT